MAKENDVTLLQYYNEEQSQNPTDVYFINRLEEIKAQKEEQQTTIIDMDKKIEELTSEKIEMTVSDLILW